MYEHTKLLNKSKHIFQDKLGLSKKKQGTCFYTHSLFTDRRTVAHSICGKLSFLLLLAASP